MNYLDIIIAIPLLWGAYNGFRKGLIIEVASLIALVAGIYGAIEFSYYISDILAQYVDWSARIMQMASFCLTFLMIVIVVHLIARGIQKIAKLAALGGLNRFLGVVFGILKYLVIVSVLVYLTNSVNNRYRFIKSETLEKSLLFDPLVSLTRGIYPNVEQYIGMED
ncbi:MAG TPA: colicin V production protein [Flavobacteriales bacterium]|nr:colicin V production protein [Flavobacteriales bacterium]